MCRDYLQWQLSALTGLPWLGLIAQAAMFSLAHEYDQSMAAFAARFIGGLTFGFIAMTRNRLLPGILGHAFQDCLAGALAVMFAR
jgi:membrane protease YdiL (CAAX protease family)